MLKIFRYFKPLEWFFAVVSLAFVTAQVWLELKLPDYMSEVTMLIQTTSTVKEILKPSGYMLLCALGSMTAAVTVGFFAARIAATIARRLRSMLFSKVDSFSMEEMNRFSTSSLITRSTNDITQIQMLITLGLQMMIKAPIMAVWAVTKIAGKGYEWSLATGSAILILSVVMVFVLIFVMPKFRKMQVLTDNLNKVARENLTGLRVVRAYNAEDYQQGKFEEANHNLTATQLFTGRSMAMMMPVMMLIMSGLSLSIYWIGAYLINNAQAETVQELIMQKATIFSDMVVFSSYAMQIVMSFMLLAMLFIFLPRAAVSAKRINEVLDTKPAIIGGTKTDGTKGLSGCVEFKNVSFRYPQAAEYVLHNVSFTVAQGETIAFIGSTGSGKSTLINLVPRFFDASEGEVLIDGVNVKEYKAESLYNKIGYVPQKAVMFRGSVAENVGYGENGREITGDDVKFAVAIAQGTDFVEAMENGYDADISQGGANVSGGQKQRIAIARAVCRKPEIYIFDDSFSALDYKTDRILRETLKKETAGVTSMIVAQRIGTIMNADQIIVLDEGEVVGSGTHKQLLQDCAVYKEIAMSQLSEEELAI